MHVSRFKDDHGRQLFKIFEHGFCMNNIPLDIIKGIQIHAIDIVIYEKFYLLGLFDTLYADDYKKARGRIEIVQSIHHVIHPTAVFSYQTQQFTCNNIPRGNIHRAHENNELTLNYEFVGHDNNNIYRERSTSVRIIFSKDVSNSETLSVFAENFTVFDFLQQQSDNLAYGNQIHVTHWNLVCVSFFTLYGDTPFFKVLDHNLFMNCIPNRFLQELQIHALDVKYSKRNYLRGLVTNNDQSYFTQKKQEPISPHDCLHMSQSIGNDHYYQKQRGGHGLFGSVGPLYDTNLKYKGLEFSPYIQNNPFSINQK